MDILINNTSAQLHGIGRPNTGTAAGALVQPSLVTLTPGLNKVDSESWKLAKQQIMVQKHIEEGTYVELKEVDSLAKLSPPEAEKYIAMLVDAKLLNEWKGIDKRVKVQKLIEDRLAHLDKPEPGTTKTDLKGGRRE